MPLYLDIIGPAPLHSLTTRIHSAMIQGGNKLARYLALDELDINVLVKSGDWVIPELGMGGYSPTKNELQITIDPTHLNLSDNFDTVFVSTLAHETHHCFRHASVGYGNTLFEALLSEGLACQFEVELGFTEPIYVNHLPSESRQALLDRAQSLWHGATYDHHSWFFGNTEQDLPRWAGYDIGYYLAGLYLEASGQTASRSCNTKAKDILKVLKRGPLPLLH